MNELLYTRATLRKGVSNEHHKFFSGILYITMITSLIFKVVHQVDQDDMIS